MATEAISQALTHKGFSRNRYFTAMFFLIYLLFILPASYTHSGQLIVVKAKCIRGLSRIKVNTGRRKKWAKERSRHFTHRELRGRTRGKNFLLPQQSKKWTEMAAVTVRQLPTLEAADPRGPGSGAAAGRGPSGNSAGVQVCCQLPSGCFVRVF